MVHRQLGDAVALLVREHGNETVQLAVEHESACDLAAVRLQPAVHVVQPQSRHVADDPVEELRGDAPRERIATLLLPARHEVESLVELREQPRNLGRIVLLVAVDRHDRRPGRLREAGGERCGLAEVPAQPDDAHVAGTCVQPCQRRERPIRRAVVDEDGLPFFDRIERGLQLLV